MKKKILLTAVVVAFCTLILCSISVSAATYGDLTYTISSGEVKITDCKASVTQVEIPATIDGYPVTSIGDNAFSWCESLRSISVPESVTSIGDNAFYWCTSLTNINIPEGITSIGNSVFSLCSSLTNITIPEGVTSIGNEAFYDCGFSSMNIPSGVTSIGNEAFSGCDNLISIIIPEGVTSIGYRMFANCRNLTSITIPESVTSIGEDAFGNCASLTSITIPDSVTIIGDSVFSLCSSLTNITIPEGVTSIGQNAFYGCHRLSTVYYNGVQEEWDEIDISAGNNYLENATRKEFRYITLIGVGGKEISKNKNNVNAPVDVSNIEEIGYTIHLYTDEECTNEFDLQTHVTENLTLYVRYIINQYSVRFVDIDERVVLDTLLDYGTVITPPEALVKERTQQYTYTFVGWDGYIEGMTVENREMIFTAKYDVTVNQYTYKFVDDGAVVKEETVDYGTAIEVPEEPDDKELYTFDCWQNYREGMTVTDDITFTAVYKYKDYMITIDDLSDAITVTYNSNFVITPPTKYGYSFVGYFSEKNGKGTQITNEKGESLKAYDIIGDLNVYSYFYSDYMNKIELQGPTSAMLGNTIKQKAILATDKEANYLVATIKYPECLNFKSILGVDFVEATRNSEIVKNGYKYLDITCIYNYNDRNIPINQNLIPFEIEFEVSVDAPLGETEISMENVMLVGHSSFVLEDKKNSIFAVMPKLAENIEILGVTQTDKSTQYTVIFTPDYTTDKTVIWSVNDEKVATISQDGTLTPVTKGTVIITATANDASGVFATKTVEIVSYAKIDGLDFGEAVSSVAFDSNIREYTVYVKEDVTVITLTPTYLLGTLKTNGGGIWISGIPKSFELTGEETIITLSRESVNNMTNSVYRVKVIKADGQKTTVSNRGKTFVIRSHDLSVGNRVFLALYDGERMVDVQTAIYDGEIIIFTTTETYTNAKVMVWDSLSSLKPVCDSEIVK